MLQHMPVQFPTKRHENFSPTFLEGPKISEGNLSLCLTKHYAMNTLLLLN